jgi:hypothetical protein
MNINLADYLETKIGIELEVIIYNFKVFINTD